MKRLNKKGFTLIELLAVIVILAVVMVVTIPSVLKSMDAARQGQLDNAVKTIEDYVNKNYELCNMEGVLATTGYDSSIFTENTCTPLTDDTIIKKAGYSTTDIPSITGAINNTTNKYVITKVNNGTELTTGKFKGATYSK